MITPAIQSLQTTMTCEIEDHVELLVSLRMRITSEQGCTDDQVSRIMRCERLTAEVFAAVKHPVPLRQQLAEAIDTPGVSVQDLRIMMTLAERLAGLCTIHASLLNDMEAYAISLLPEA